MRAGRPETALDALQQEELLGASAEEELDQALEEQLQTSADPMQQLMLLQMRQMSMMAQQFKKKAVDPIQAALQGSQEGSGVSSSGIKGCLAREAYCTVAEDLIKIAQTTESNALADLGLGAGDLTPGLMKEFLERRIPLGDFKLLTQIGYLAAAGWEKGSRSKNREMQGFMALILMFVEQTAIDNGRSSLSWLLTGLSEPNFAICQRNRVKSGLRPFARLAHPSWVAANIGYLRDLDFLENRIKQAGPAAAKETNEEQKTPGNGSPFPKKKPKKKAAKALEDAAATTTPAA